MNQGTRTSFLGPVGFFILALGYIVATSIARVFVAIESVCIQACPAIHVQGFRFHHMYYGFVIALVSAGVLFYAQDIRTRWDSALILGIGVGLIVDEIGLLILKLSYWNIVSVGLVMAGGLSLMGATFYESFRQGFSEFRLLDRYQSLAILALVLAFTGFLYFDKPVRSIVEITAIASWLTSVGLVAKYGRKHLWLIRHTPLAYDPQPR